MTGGKKTGCLREAIRLDFHTVSKLLGRNRGGGEKAKPVQLWLENHSMSLLLFNGLRLDSVMLSISVEVPFGKLSVRTIRHPFFCGL